MRALILDARNARASLAAARALAADGWTVGIAAPCPDGLAAASRRVAAFRPVPRPEAGAEPFAAALHDAVQAGGYEVVFASSDVDLLALSAVRDRIGATVPYPPDAVLRRALDKLPLTRAAERAGLRVPRTSEGGTDLPAMPVVVKERIHGDLAAGGPAHTTGTDIVGDREAVRTRLAALAAAGGAGIVHTLDAIVALRGRVGERRRAPLRRALLRRLARRPAAAFLLDVGPQTAWERKGEQGPVPLRRQRDLYLAEHDALGVERLDGERPVDELAAHIAWRVWRALGP